MYRTLIRPIIMRVVLRPQYVEFLLVFINLMTFQCRIEKTNRHEICIRHEKYQTTKVHSIRRDGRLWVSVAGENLHDIKLPHDITKHCIRIRDRKTKSYYDDNFVVTDGSGGCHSSLDQYVVKPVDDNEVTKFLGVQIDSQLTWKIHIEYTC